MPECVIIPFHHWSLATHKAHGGESDRTRRMPRLIWVFAGRTCHLVDFVVLRLILWKNVPNKGWMQYTINLLNTIGLCDFNINEDLNLWLWPTEAAMKLKHSYQNFVHFIAHNSKIQKSMNWAPSWENLFLPYANNSGADQPAHPPSLISTFVVRCLVSIISLVSISEISSL